MGAAVGAFALSNGDSAVLLDLPAGDYSAVITGVGGDTGVALAEVYDASGADTLDAKLVNLSTRAYVGTGDGILVPGFVIASNSPRTVLIRAIGGKALQDIGVSGALQNPKIQLLLETGPNTWQEVASNDDWGQAANAGTIRLASDAMGAFAIPTESQDAAILTSLPRGRYSILVSGVGDTSGIALVEVYPTVN